MQRLADIRQRYTSSSERYSKYADVERWLKINIARVQALKLHRSSPKEILDLGCGGGFFLFICQQLGHRGLGLDIDELPLLRELVDLLHAERKVWRIGPFEPLPDLGRKFDWITAFSTAFNRSGDESRGWDAAEWAYLLDDLHRRLKPGGKIFLEVNSGKTKKYFPPDVRELFLRRGARVEGERILFGNVFGQRNRNAGDSCKEKLPLTFRQRNFASSNRDQFI